MSQPSLTVLVAADGRHLFDNISDPRVRVTSDASIAEPQLVVFPVSRYRRFDNLVSITLPEPLRKRIADRQAGLVFDASLEGVMHKPDITAALHQVIDQFGAVPQQCVYVTQDRQYRLDYEEHCAAIGATPVTVLAHDYWIWDALGQYASNGEASYQERLAAFRGRSASRSRRFVSLNRTPRPSKILFLLSVLRDGLWNAGHVSFGGFRDTGDGPGKARPTGEQLADSLPGFEALVAEVAPLLGDLERRGRVLLGLEQHGWRRVELTQASQAVPLAEYDDSWFTIVTETEMRSRVSRITEKVIKPLVNFHPLLVLGNPGALQMIREYGFVTFEHVLDERYDLECDPRKRFELVYAEFRRLCAMDERAMARLEAEVGERLIFNARWGLTRFPTVYRRQRDAALVNEIAAAVESYALA